MASPQPALRQSPHIHIVGQKCPTCDQPIPNDKAEQVRARIEARDRELTAAAKALAASEFAQDKARIEASAKASIDAMTAQMAAKEAAARADGAKTAQAAMQEKLTALAQAKDAAEIAAKERTEAAEAAKVAAEIEAKDRRAEPRNCIERAASRVARRVRQGQGGRRRRSRPRTLRRAAEASHHGSGPSAPA